MGGFVANFNSRFHHQYVSGRQVALSLKCHDGKYENSSTHSEGEVMSIDFVGIDLAKKVFALHGVNAAGAVQLRQPKVARAKLNELVTALPPWTIEIEACSGAHHRCRLLAARGHTVRLVEPAREVTDHVKEPRACWQQRAKPG